MTLAAAGTDAQQALRFDRAAIVQGQWYRLLTCHFVHLGWKHAFLNCSGLLLLPALMEEAEPVRIWLWKLLVLSLGVGSALFTFMPQLEWYLGLSGVLHGLFVLVLGRFAIRGDAASAVVLLILIGKIILEHYHGPLQFSRAMVDAPIIVSAHSYGVMTAIAYLSAAWIAEKNKKDRERKPRPGN